jgi:hypothetical protein
MTTLCLDCQRHERHLHQFRAMFVMNMHVNRDEVFEFKEPAKKQARWQQQKRAKADDNGDAQAAADGAGEGDGAVPGPASEATRPEDQFNPAYCAECSTLVGTAFFLDCAPFFFNSGLLKAKKTCAVRLTPPFFPPSSAFHCSQVAMYDIDEVYHFFNVIDSEG